VRSAVTPIMLCPNYGDDDRAFCVFVLVDGCYVGPTILPVLSRIQRERERHSGFHRALLLCPLQWLRLSVFR